MLWREQRSQRGRCQPECDSRRCVPPEGGFMAAIDDLTELVERAAAAEKSALASKWKDEPDVQSLIRRARTAAVEQRQAVRLDADPDQLSPRWAGLRQNYLDLGAQPALPGQELSVQEPPDDG